MRSEQEMMNLILSIAKKDDRIRMVTLEGSRTNKNIPKDLFQDYDVTFFVTEMDTFKTSDEWLSVFGRQIFIQKPEDMELFPPEWGNWFSYLMLFEDGNRIDLTLIPLLEKDDYFSKSDGLVKVLLDKDEVTNPNITPSDRKYWVKKPSEREFDDCCNEFWWVSTYVVKGLCRKEILFAIDHLNQIVRYELLRMITWKVGIDTDFKLSVGKNHKFLKRYVSDELWKTLMTTYDLSSYEKVWESLSICQKLFREVSKEIAKLLSFEYPAYDENITRYIEECKRN
ncbi:TPA: aminoglycoside 6-adenylyltransferase, partial [Streptococcus pyogenes]